MRSPRNPTQQELMEYVDGTLSPGRFREIEQSVMNSKSLQQEIELLHMMRMSVAGTVVVPEKNFTADIVSAIIPQQKISFWLRLANNSSNIFAMVLVLSLIGIVLTSAPGTQYTGKGFISRTMDSYSSAFSSALDTLSGWGKQYSEPVNLIGSTSSGKLLLLALGVFFLFVVLDDLFGKRFIQHRNKHLPQ